MPTIYSMTQANYGMYRFAQKSEESPLEAREDCVPKSELPAVPIPPKSE